MDQIQRIIDGFIDFEGQRLAETLTTLILGFTGIAAFLTGYVLSDLKYTVYVGLSGTALTFLAVVPPWPVYNKNGLEWLPVVAVGTEEGGEQEPETKKAK